MKNYVMICYYKHRRTIMKRKSLLLFIPILSILFFNSVANPPNGLKPVEPFDKEKFLGKWFEIARFDFTFEKDLNNTTATYSLNKNGTIKVENQGFNYKKNKWQKVIGKAKFAGSENVGYLKVSFFGPFYSPYVVIALDQDYKYALVAGGSLKLLWILSREPTIPENIKEQYLKIAQSYGYDTSNLVWVEHNK